MQHLQGLTLAHSVSANHSFEVSVLIGTITTGHLYKTTLLGGNGPTVLQSKLGYLLSEPLPCDNPSFSSFVMVQITTNYP